MAKMRIDEADRPQVKIECLRLLATLRLDPARTKLISGFVDTYLRLNVQEEQVFQEAVGTLEGTEREGIMQIVTSWMEQGITEGEQRGRTEGITEGRTEEARSLVLRQLTRRAGILPSEIRSQVESLNLEKLESLGEALLDFSSSADLDEWLRSHS
jgi:predicted transposase YdaD